MEPTNRNSVDRNTVKQERMRRREEARSEHLRARQNKDKLLVEFQPDAVELEHRSVPGGARWTLYTVIALIIGFVAWSYWAEVDRIVVANGKLITTETPVVLQPITTMEIKKINVGFGDKVRVGEVLATLDPTFSDADVQQLENKQKSLQSNIARGLAEREGTPFSLEGHEDEEDWRMQYQLFQERQKEKDAKLEEFDSERNKIEVQKSNTVISIEHNKERVEIFLELEQSSERLRKKGSHSEIDLLSRKLQRKEAETKLLDLESGVRSSDADLESLDKRRTAYIASWNSEVASGLLESFEKLAEVEQELKKARHMDESDEVRVPPNEHYDEFIVLEVADLSAGSVVKAGEPLFRLMPLDVPLEMEIEIAGRDIGRVRAVDKMPKAEELKDFEFPKGSEVTVKINAFNYQKHGFLNGVVRTISEGAFEKQGENQQPGMANYRGRVELLHPVRLDNVPDDFRLMPGMTASAEIKVGKRRVIEYFLYPILRYLDNGLREP